MSWVAHDLEPYVLQRHLGIKLAFFPALLGSYAPDLMTKWFVYGITVFGYELKASDPIQFHRGWPGFGFTHSLLFGALVGLVLWKVLGSKIWGVSFVLGHWAHAITDCGDTVGTMLFFPWTLHVHFAEALPRIERAEAFFAAAGLRIRHGGYQAYYAIGDDRIQMPPFEAFRDRESYYATLAHEGTHWTRHPSRLDRSFDQKRFSDEGYAMEELVAELGAAFLCAGLALTPEIRDDHASYLDHWLKVLKADKRAIFTAAAHAQRAADFLHGLQPQSMKAAA